MGRTKDEIYLQKLGAKLRKMREDRGWTLEQTEEHGWPNWRHLQRIETGKNVTVLTLLRLANLYGVSLPELFPQ